MNATSPTCIQRPVISEVIRFDLTMPEAVDPLQMVTDSGYEEGPESWSYDGTPIPPGTVRPFALIGPLSGDSLSRIQEQLKHWYRMPSGLWREAFLRQFPNPHEGKMRIGIPDPSWRRRGINVPLFPCLFVKNDQWNPRFTYVDFYRNDWLWLVETDPAPSPASL